MEEQTRDPIYLLVPFFLPLYVSFLFPSCLGVWLSLPIGSLSLPLVWTLSRFDVLFYPCRVLAYMFTFLHFTGLCTRSSLSLSCCSPVSLLFVADPLKGNWLLKGLKEVSTSRPQSPLREAGPEKNRRQRTSATDYLHSLNHQASDATSGGIGGGTKHSRTRSRARCEHVIRAWLQHVFFRPPGKGGNRLPSAGAIVPTPR